MADIKELKSDEDINAMDASDVEEQTGNDASDIGEDEVYVVERILKHMDGQGGQKRYLIKWEGYSDSENTWEDEDNIIDKEILKKYWDGVRSKNQARTKSSTVNGKASQQPQPPVNKRRRTADMVTSDNEDEAEDIKTVNPNSMKENWEILVKEIMTIDKANDQSLVVFIKWKDGTSSEHPVEAAYAKCPQVMLKFYEERLRFRAK